MKRSFASNQPPLPPGPPPPVPTPNPYPGYGYGPNAVLPPLNNTPSHPQYAAYGYGQQYNAGMNQPANPAYAQPYYPQPFGSAFPGQNPFPQQQHGSPVGAPPSKRTRYDSQNQSGMPIGPQQPPMGMQQMAMSMQSNNAGFQATNSMLPLAVAPVGGNFRGNNRRNNTNSNHRNNRNLNNSNPSGEQNLQANFQHVARSNNLPPRPNQNFNARNNNMNNRRSMPGSFRSNYNSYPRNSLDGRGPDASRGPRNQGNQRMHGMSMSNNSQPRRERKWGVTSSQDKEKREDKKDEVKRILTDFRIMALECPELSWEWKGREPVESTQDTDKPSPTQLVDDCSELNVDSLNLSNDKESDVSADGVATLAESVSLQAHLTETDETLPEEVDSPANETLLSTLSLTGNCDSPPKPKTNKHGREDDDEDQAIKKVKAESHKPESDLSMMVSLLHSLPAKPVVTAVTPEDYSNEARAISPTPSAMSISGVTAERAVSVPPENRENSRLRIYFSSPVSSGSNAQNGFSQLAAIPEQTTEVDINEDLDGEAIDTSLLEPVVPSSEPLDEGNSESRPGDEKSTEKMLKEKLELTSDDATALGEEEKQSVKSEEQHVEHALEQPLVNPPPGTSEAEEETKQPPSDDNVEAVPIPSVDRLSISYAKNTRRMVIDADVVDKVVIHRTDGKIFVTVRILPTSDDQADGTPDKFRICKGILVEALDPKTDEYHVMERDFLDKSSTMADSLLLPLHRLLEDENESSITLIATLDRCNPLTEARWVKTGEVDPWILSLPTPTGISKPSTWRNKISVRDPDPPPTIHHALETWTSTSAVGTNEERTEFVSEHLSHIDNIFEILLRLTRGDRAGPSHHTASTQPASVGALAAALNAPYAEHQTQVSLAVLGLFRLSLETAAKAGIPTAEIEKQVGEIIRGIPYHLIFKSLDGMFREQRGLPFSGKSVVSFHLH